MRSESQSLPLCLSVKQNLSRVTLFVPVFMILGGAFLIILFIHRQKINDILKSSDEDLIDDGDIENF